MQGALASIIHLLLVDSTDLINKKKSSPVSPVSLLLAVKISPPTFFFIFYYRILTLLWTTAAVFPETGSSVT